MEAAAFKNLRELCMRAMFASIRLRMQRSSPANPPRQTYPCNGPGLAAWAHERRQEIDPQLQG